MSATPLTEPPHSRTLVLASTSPYRRALLERLGLAFSWHAPACDEEALKDARAPAELAVHLAREKALSLRAAMPNAFILGGDQLVELDGATLSKPGSVEAAVAQLMRLSGRRHQLWTAIALACPDGRVLTHLDEHALTLRALPEAAVRRYVLAERPLDCAGSYKIEGLGIALCERIEGEDFTAITGLPLIALCRMLREHGFEVP